MKKYNWRLSLAKVCIIVYIIYKQPNFNKTDSYLLVSQISSTQSFYQRSITQDKYINDVNESFEELIIQLDENTLGNVPDYREKRQTEKKMRRDKVYQKYKNRKQVRTLLDLPPLIQT